MSDLAACQVQPYLRTYTTKVIECTPTPSLTAPAETTAADKKNRRREEKKEQTEQTYDVLLEDTILYPEGGGQPSDYGLINDNIMVKNVKTCIDGRILHTVSEALTVGSIVNISLDWNRRYDHMQQHSSQHLISAMFIKYHSIPTISWWLSSTPNECHIELDTIDMNQDILSSIEQHCNDTIRRALPIHTHVYPSISAALDDPIFVSKLPQHKVLGDHLTGSVRVIEISDIDMNPCGGTHLINTAEMQLIHLTRWDKQRGHIRIFFLAGQRAINTLSLSLDISRQLAALLSVTGEGQIDIVKKLLADQRSLNKQNTKLIREVAEIHASNMMKDLSNDHYIMHYHRDDSNQGFLGIVAETFATQLSSQSSSSLSSIPYLLFLTCSDSGDSKEGQYVLFGCQASSISSDINRILEGRGGGKGNKVQGKANRIDKRGDAFTFIQQKLQSNNNQQPSLSSTSSS